MPWSMWCRSIPDFASKGSKWIPSLLLLSVCLQVSVLEVFDALKHVVQKYLDPASKGSTAISVPAPCPIPSAPAKGYSRCVCVCVCVCLCKCVCALCVCALCVCVWLINISFLTCRTASISLHRLLLPDRKCYCVFFILINIMPPPLTIPGAWYLFPSCFFLALLWEVLAVPTYHQACFSPLILLLKENQSNLYFVCVCVCLFLCVCVCVCVCVIETHIASQIVNARLDGCMLCF